MLSAEELLNFILQQDRCIVFGDLGRYPYKLFEILKSIPSLKVMVISSNNNLYSSDNQIRVQRSDQLVESCDLLIYLEPESMQTIAKHRLASRVVVFASHLNFIHSCDARWARVCFFLKIDPTGTRSLLDRQDFSIQTQNVGSVRVDYTNVVRISGKDNPPLETNDTYVIVDLTHYTKDILSMFLAFWDAFDFMLENKDSISRWVLCFAEKGYSGFCRFRQKTLDALSCKDFEYGNVTDIQTILSMLPFYKFGNIDKKFNVKLSSFGGVKYIIPKSEQEACKAAYMYNVYPMVNNVLRVR